MGGENGPKRYVKHDLQSSTRRPNQKRRLSRTCPPLFQGPNLITLSAPQSAPPALANFPPEKKEPPKSSEILPIQRPASGRAALGLHVFVDVVSYPLLAGLHTLLFSTGILSEQATPTNDLNLRTRQPHIHTRQPHIRTRQPRARSNPAYHLVIVAVHNMSPTVMNPQRPDKVTPGKRMRAKKFLRAPMTGRALSFSAWPASRDSTEECRVPPKHDLPQRQDVSRIGTRGRIRIHEVKQGTEFGARRGPGCDREEPVRKSTAGGSDTADGKNVSDGAVDATDESGMSRRSLKMSASHRLLKLRAAGRSLSFTGSSGTQKRGSWRSGGAGAWPSPLRPEYAEFALAVQPGEDVVEIGPRLPDRERGLGGCEVENGGRDVFGRRRGDVAWEESLERPAANVVEEKPVANLEQSNPAVIGGGAARYLDDEDEETLRHIDRAITDSKGRLRRSANMSKAFRAVIRSGEGLVRRSELIQASVDCDDQKDPSMIILLDEPQHPVTDLESSNSDASQITGDSTSPPATPGFSTSMTARQCAATLETILREMSCRVDRTAVETESSKQVKLRVVHEQPEARRGDRKIKVMVTVREEDHIRTSVSFKRIHTIYGTGTADAHVPLCEDIRARFQREWPRVVDALYIRLPC